MQEMSLNIRIHEMCGLVCDARNKNFNNEKETLLSFSDCGDTNLTSRRVCVVNDGSDSYLSWKHYLPIACSRTKVLKSS